MSKSTTRREFIANSLITSAGLSLGAESLSRFIPCTSKPAKLQLSVAQWSWHRTIGKGQFSNLDFAVKARSFEIDAIEYVSRFFEGKEGDPDYLKELNMRADDNEVKQLLIMVDGEGNLGDQSKAERQKAVENHKKWLEAAQALGCHSIRVNAAGQGSYQEVHDNAVQGLRTLATVAQPYGINVIVENHGGFSSDGQWLSSVISKVNMDNCGTLPDFGNFCIEYGSDGCKKSYDRYKGVEELMPFAKAVSAKSYQFDDEGQEINMDFKKLVDIVKAAGYEGYIGIEYEGSEHTEDNGVLLTKNLLEKYI